MIIDETKKVKVNEISLEEPKKEELTKKMTRKLKIKKKMKLMNQNINSLYQILMVL